MNTLQKCLDLLDDLQKARKKGEGSKGGQIIGHTRSGKAIYSHTRPHHLASAGWKKRDFEDAADAHNSVAAQSRGKVKEHHSNQGERFEDARGTLAFLQGEDARATSRARYAKKKGKKTTGSPKYNIASHVPAWLHGVRQVSRKKK